LGSNSSCFSKMEGYLHAQGYTVYALNYSCFGADIAACGRDLAREAVWLRHQTGSESVKIVAHSLGGMVVRWSIAHTWMRDWVNLVVTLGTPHRGTPIARLAPSSLPGFGKIISELRPGAGADDAALPEGLGTNTRWVAVAGAHDWVVPPRCAHLQTYPCVRNVTVPGRGHLTLPNSGHCLQIVLEELAAAEPRHRASGPGSAATSQRDASPLPA
jgi:pimeloyl-ACP methyl ester carboxylesterase